MYLPSATAEHRLEVIHDFIEARAFGTLVTASAQGIAATPVPLLLDRAVAAIVAARRPAARRA